MDIRKVKKLIELLEESGVSEIEIKEGEESVRISRHPTGTVHAYSAPMGYAPAPPGAPGAAVPAAALAVAGERENALRALGDVAGRTPTGLAELASLAADPAVPEEQRLGPEGDGMLVGLFEPVAAMTFLARSRMVSS